MPRITYHEYRPGHWAKLVDGKAVGTATPEEVAQWRRERKAQERIWEDVVGETAPAPDQAVVEEKAQKEQAAIWSDVLTHAEERPARRRKAAARTEAVQPPSSHPPAKREHIPATSARREAALQSGRAPVERPASASKATKRGRRGAPGKVAVPRARPAVETAKVKEATPAELPPKKVQEAAASKPSLQKAPAAVKEKAPPKGVRKARRVSKAARRERPLEQPIAAQAAEPISGERRAQVEAAPVQELPTAPPRPIEMPPAEAQAELELEAEPEEVERPAVAEVGGAEPAEPVTPAQPARRPRRAAGKRAAKGPAALPGAEGGPSYLWVVAAATDDLGVAVRAGLARYQERSGQPAEAVFCHEDDLPVLEKAGLPVDVRQGKRLPRRNFWIGPK